MSFPKYPEYKDSGVEWLGEVPAHWGLKKIAWHVPYTVGWTPSSGKEEYYDGDNLWVTIADLNKPVIHDTKSKISDKAVSDRGGRLSPAGSMLFSFKLTVGNVSFLGKQAYTNEAIASFEPNEYVDLVYWSYAAPQFIPKYGRENIYGALLLNQELIGAVRFYAPDIEEQKRISRFLDHETARIDALVEEQQCLIALLKEKRQAVISHAVTKGLDPDVPMKDSGVEWLGEVPAHWEVTRLKFVARIVDCKNRTPSYHDDGEFLVVRTSNVKSQSLIVDGAFYTNEEDFNVWTQRGVPPEGSILFTREAPAGEVCLVPENMPLCLGQRMMNIIPSDSRITFFVFDFLTSDCLSRYINSVSHGSTVSHLRVEQVYDIPLVVPPLSEQEAIDLKVSALKQQFTKLIDEAESAVKMLSERRSALISAAVTGKIDVRDWLPPEGSTASSEAAQVEMV
ncbi:restriction endonuclease subunit S [Halomonas sp. PAR8]|uniref:restriction endonuclease subunit S n=1 Tax=Halomonas sp. PAR8 TaxID=3075515 RepID=UPI00288438D7|nr:restriction endonuclease subunit S [Halomonas sp. PAR8]MDT0592049.1 restriction endonuclease subunit S [Halomonas sp. PAR8]